MVVMGRKTLESLPGGKPLKNRVNVVLTRDESFKQDNVIVVNSIEELKGCVKAYKEITGKDVFIIGGGEIYNSLLCYCHEAYVTKIHSEFICDTHICNLDTLSDWEIIEEGKTLHDNNTEYNYILYRKRK